MTSGLSPSKADRDMDHWHNKAAWDRLAIIGDRLAKPAREIDFENPLQSVDGPGWLGDSIVGLSLIHI